MTRTTLAPKKRSAREPAGSGTAIVGRQTATPLPDQGTTIHRHRSLIGFALLSLFLQSLIFAPISLWPVAFVCLAPWLIMVGASQTASRVYGYSLAMGFAFYLINMRWMIPATREGYAALSLCQALYFPLLACPIRHMVRRRGWPLAIAFPLIWTAGEMLRAVVLSGFPWFFLSHSLYRVLPLIQISDVLGAYGVSFVLAGVNGAVADWFLSRLRPPPEIGWGPAPMSYARRVRISAIVAVSLVVVSLAYGIFQLLRDTSHPGPRAAVLQGDFVMTVHDEEMDDTRKRQIYFEMLEAAARQKPDLYVLPETPWIMYLNQEARDFYPFSRQSFLALQSHVRHHDAYLVTGSASERRTPYDFLTDVRRYNSAMVFSPDGSEPSRYDKVHLVYFGEVVPFRFGRLRPLYFFLNRMMPFSNNGKLEFSLFPGEDFRTFSMKAASVEGREFRFGIPICYEDVMPYIAREFVHGGDKKRVDFLLNISNDGWFGRGIQQPQHLATCVFRAIENRIGIARAVNTGVSAFIDPSGKIHHRVVGDPSDPWPGECGFQVAQLTTDTRYALYTRYGDWFGWMCAVALLVFYVDYWVARARTLSEED